MPDGALALDRDGADLPVTRSGVPLPVVVDPVGAGDAFCAGFIAARLDGTDLAEALEIANACGASAAAALGDQTGPARPGDAGRHPALGQRHGRSGHHPMTVPFERDELVEALIAAEPAAAARRDEIVVVRAPGRVNLIGEHTDYNMGFVLPAAIDLELRIAYLPTDDDRVELVRLDTGERDGFDLGEPRSKTGSWIDYVAGTAWALDEAGLPLTGLRGVIASTLPPNAGLSSSAAIELASAWAMLDDVGPTMDPFTLARICQRAENGYVGVQSGLMDQFAEACGVAGSAVLLDCRSLEWRPIPLPDDVALVVLHTGSRRHLDGSAYNERRSQCEAAVAELARDRPAHHEPARRDAWTSSRPRATGSIRSRSPGRSTSSTRTPGSRRRLRRSRPTTSTRSAGSSPRATRRSATCSRSARPNSTRWSRSRPRSTASSGPG